MASSESENETNTLLRAILDAVSGYNWNPITFAFTAAIGALALVVAIVTVFQNVLSSGPGRLKASKAAIGRYAQEAVTKFDWNELRYGTTGQVPYIQLKQWTEAMFDTPQKPLYIDPSPHFQRALPAENATWLTLVQDVGFGNFDFPTLPCRTDYLPHEILAAPAYADVQSICILAAIAGCDNISRDYGLEFPGIRGDSSQANFFNNAILGPTAAYTRFLARMSYQAKSYQWDFLRSIFEAMGRFEYGPHGVELLVSIAYLGNGAVIIKDLQRHCAACGHVDCNFEVPGFHLPSEIVLVLLAADPPCARVVPVAKLGIHAALQSLFDVAQLRDASPSEFRDTIGTFIVGGNVRVLSDVDFRKQHFLGDRFERRRVQEMEGIPPATLISCSDSWVYEPQDSHNPIRTVGHLRPPWFGFGVVSEQDLVIIEQALNVTHSWLINQQFALGFDSERMVMESERKGYVRAILQFQLQELDWWLWKNGGRAASCEALRLFKGYGEFVESKKVGETYYSGMRALLLYRAAVFATLCATGADNSVVCETDLGRRIVRLL